MAKKKRKRTLEQICRHYQPGMKHCPHVMEDGSCSQRKNRPKLCRERFLVKVKGEDAEESDAYVLFS